MSPAPSSKPIEVFWTPHCSSCMAVKNFLDNRGVVYRSVNVIEDETAMARLAALGIRTVPVVVRGDRFVFAQYLEDVSSFLELEKTGPAPLDRLALASRLIQLLEIAEQVIVKTPDVALAQNLPGRDRSYFVVAHHVFQIAAAARRGIPDGYLRDQDSLAEPPEDMITRDRLQLFAQEVLTQVRNWPMQLTTARETDNVVTDYGPRTLAEVLHRVVSHAAQHTRQLVTWARTQHVELDRGISPALLNGLTVADETFDQKIS
jgi:glutaredoxin